MGETRFDNDQALIERHLFAGFDTWLARIIDKIAGIENPEATKANEEFYKSGRSPLGLLTDILSVEPKLLSSSSLV